MNTNSPITLQPWQKQQAAWLYHAMSKETFRGYFERVNRVIAFADKTLDEAALQQRDRFLVSDRWGVRDTSANWGTHAFPALMDLRQDAIELMAHREHDIYDWTNYQNCVRILREYSMGWSSPDEEKQFEELFDEVGNFAWLIDQVCNRTKPPLSPGLLHKWWKSSEASFPRLPKFQVRTDIEGVSGEVPPRTGVYVPQNDPYGAAQFAWIGKKAYRVSGVTELKALGTLQDCATLNDVGIEAVRHFGWEKFWEGAPIEMLAFVRARYLAEFEHWLKNQPDPVYPYESRMLNDPDHAEYFLGNTGITRSCKWHYVELIEGEYEDPEPEVSKRAARLRGEPGEVVPQSGWWHTLALKGEEGFRRFEQGQHFPDTKLTGWGAVIWLLDPERQPKA